MLESGVKPIYVFDGQAPELKSGELEKRKERRKEAEKGLANANTSEDVEKFSKRLVRVTRQHNEECKKLLQLLGCPIVCAPSEAEAQCAELCKEGLVYAIATEDMDGLTFGTPKLIRNLSSGRADDKAKEYNLDKVLAGLELTHDQFIDLCILMGCDYCSSIKGIGGKKGLELIRKYGSIEEILREKYNVHEFVDVVLTYKENRETEKKVKEEKEDEENKHVDVDMQQEAKQEQEQDEKGDDRMDNDSVKQEPEQDDDVKAKEEIDQEAISDDEATGIDEEYKLEEDEDDEEDPPAKVKSEKVANKRVAKKEVNPVPKNWLFRGARQLFKEPNVLRNKITETDLKFKDVDEEGLIQFLCEQNGFSEERIRPAINRLRAAKQKSNQSRIDSFFKVIPNQNQPKTPAAANKKRPSTGKGSESKRGRRPR